MAAPILFEKKKKLKTSRTRGTAVVYIMRLAYSSIYKREPNTT
jgi:hypothetical protein